MIDLSDKKHVKQLCMWLCGDRAHHASNLSRINWHIQRRYISQNLPIDWNTVQADCRELVRIYILEYMRISKLPTNTFSLRDKMGMASNILEHFKIKYGAPPDKHNDYIMEMLERIRAD